MQMHTPDCLGSTAGSVNRGVVGEAVLLMAAVNAVAVVVMTDIAVEVVIVVVVVVAMAAVVSAVVAVVLSSSDMIAKLFTMILS